MTDPQQTRPRRSAALLTLVVGVAVTGAIAAGPAAAATPTTRPVAGPSATTQPDAAATTAVSALAELSIKPAASTTGYSRDQFGPAWTDNQDAPGGHNGCDTRDDVLRRDLTNLDVDTDGCTVESGHLSDPYVGKSIDFTRGTGTSTAVQIDHMVALSDAWQTGAQSLTLAQRTELGNDPLNLWAVDGPTNESKGDGDASEWLPPKTSSDCIYVARQVAVKLSYSLWVTQAEHDAIASVLATCPSLALPTEAGWAVPAPTS